MTTYKREQRNVLKGGQIKFKGARWTAPGLDLLVYQQAQLTIPLGVDWTDPAAAGPIATVNGRRFPLVRVGATRQDAPGRPETPPADTY